MSNHFLCCVQILECCGFLLFDFFFVIRFTFSCDKPTHCIVIFALTCKLTQWTWTWAGSRSWWWTGKPSMKQSMGLQRVRHDWEAELNWKRLENEIKLLWLIPFYHILVIFILLCRTKSDPDTVLFSLKNLFYHFL